LREAVKIKRENKWYIVASEKKFKPLAASAKINGEYQGVWRKQQRMA